MIENNAMQSLPPYLFARIEKKIEEAGKRYRHNKLGYRRPGPAYSQTYHRPNG